MQCKGRTERSRPAAVALGKKTADEKAMKKATKAIHKDIKKNGGQSDHKTYDPETKTVTTTEEPTKPGPNSP